ncbi:MAG: hypothetical protein JWN34_4057, partial [Bryobacterales bacterium]|nr:hypothetical protein [Bryobacterales bacterium]
MRLKRGFVSLALLLLYLFNMPAAYSASTRIAPRNVEFSRPAGAPLYFDAVIPEG